MSRWHLVTEDYPPGFVGGIASWALDLGDALSGAGESVTVHARRTGDTKRHDAALPYEVRRMRGRHWSRWGSRWAQRSLSGVLKQGDRVIASRWGLVSHSLGAIRRRGASLGIAFHGSDLTQLSEASPTLHQVTGAAAALLPVSHFLAGELCRLGLTNHEDPRVRVLPVPLPELPSRDGPGEGLVCVARPTPLKGIDRAQALARALELPLTLVGPSPDQGGTGILSRSEAHAAVSRAAAAVLLPRAEADGRGAEGLGIVLLEAAAMGVPVIGCATGGVPEAIGPGLLVDPETPDLAAIRALIDNPEAGAEAQVWVREHHGASRAIAALREALP